MEHTPGSSGTSSTPADRLAATPGVTALRSALQSALRHGAPDGELRRAITIVGAEARRRGLFAEQVVITLKEAWYSLPEIRERSRPAARDALLERLVAQAIDAFYASGNAEVADVADSAARPAARAD